MNLNEWFLHNTHAQGGGIINDFCVPLTLHRFASLSDRMAQLSIGYSRSK